MQNNNIETVTDFLINSEISSTHCFESFKQLSVQLENKKESAKAKALLSDIMSFHSKNNSPSFAKRYHFSFIEVDISNKHDFSEPLYLLQFPSTFTPEEWSYTFFEGLSRSDFSEFNEKKMVELGCGNGWITIALGKKYFPEHIYGLDINPRAIVASKINLYINSVDNKGELIIDSQGKCLLDRVSFHESNLLSYFKGKSSFFDIIVGCIPQVLSPSEDVFDDIISEDKNDDFLYSLSNYCGKQGYIEDQFGLGLIAKSVEESIDLLKNNGKLFLNLGGRPGEQVLQRLFARRGLTVKKIWERRVVQAGDTEVDPLVEIENKSPHRFEFFIGKNSSEPISAKTAQYFSRKGGEITHTLSVYQFKIKQHKKIANIFNLFKDKDYSSALSGLDLAYSSQVETAEKINFLSELSTLLRESKYFPYEETAGEPLFRARLAQYFNSYFHTRFSKKQVLITPRRVSCIYNILHIYKPEVIIVDKKLSRASSFDKMFCDINVIEAPTSSFELCSLIENIEPQFVIVEVNEEQVSQVDAFESILNACKKVKSRLIVDISPYFELSSKPNKIGILSYASKYGLPAYCSIICGFTNNRVYEDLQLSMFISEDEHIINNLAFSAEFTYSRTPILTQHYYSVLIFELLKFQMAKMRDISHIREFTRSDTLSYIQPQSYVLDAFDHPSIKGNTLPIVPSTTRLDYGENELLSSKHVKVSMFESFVRQHFSQEEIDPTPEISQLIYNRFSIDNKPIEICFGNGVAPLFSAVTKNCKEEGGTLIFPNGSYGYFFATAKFYDANVVILPTIHQNSFKVSLKEMENIFQQINNPYLFLNFPLVNPTGALYSQKETDELFSTLAKNDVIVIIDAVFSGLEYEGVKTLDIGKYVSHGLKYVLIGGISKEFSAGGLRFGFAVTQDKALSKAFDNFVIDKPHSTITYTVKRLYKLLIKNEPSLISDLEKQQKTLAKRYFKLNKVLTDLGWDVLTPKGGLFLVAKPEKYLGLSFSYEKSSFIITSTNINEALFYSINLLINNDVWTGISGFCRFVLSVEEHVFNVAIDKLKAFDELMMKQNKI